MLAGAVGIVIIFVFAMLQPMIRTIQATQADIVATKTDLVEKETFLRTLDSKLADLELNKSHENQLDVMLPKADRMEDALRVLHTSAASTGITLAQVSNTSGAAQSEAVASQARGDQGALPKNVAPLGIGLDVTGPYQAFRAFLTQLETTPRLMDITRLELRLNEDQPDQILGSMSLQFYKLSEADSSAL